MPDAAVPEPGAPGVAELPDAAELPDVAAPLEVSPEAPALEEVDA